MVIVIRLVRDYFVWNLPNGDELTSLRLHFFDPGQCGPNDHGLIFKNDLTRWLGRMKQESDHERQTATAKCD